MYDRTLATLGASGGGLLGAMGRYLEPLDYPRRALWNIPSKLANADIGDMGAIAPMLPGLLGVGAGGLAAATGFGLPAAIGIGSLVGGLGQAAGESADEERFRAPTPEDVTGSDNWVLNALVGAVGDPLTYAGGFGGRRAGLKAGEMLGAGERMAAEEAAPFVNAFEHRWHGAPAATPEMPPLMPAVPPVLDPVPELGGQIPFNGPPGFTEPLASPVSSAMGDTFYSRLRRALETEPGQEFKTAGLEKRLLAGKFGGQGPINPDEIQYSGLPELLAGGPTVTKNELLKALEQKSLGLDRTVLSGSDVKWPSHQIPPGENYRETLLKAPSSTTDVPVSSEHFENEPNIVAWIRSNEQTLPSGERMLLGNEMQSDWHQAGKKYGYRSPEDASALELAREELKQVQDRMREIHEAQLQREAGPPRWAEANAFVNQDPEFLTLRQRVAPLQDRIDQFRERLETPEGPFKDTWPDLALKQLLYDAAKGDFERVGWNAGADVKAKVGGKLPGQHQFYDRELPARMSKILQALGGGTVESSSDVADMMARAEARSRVMTALKEHAKKLSEGSYNKDVGNQWLAGAKGEADKILEDKFPQWTALGLDPEAMSKLASWGEPAAVIPDRPFGHQIRMTPELRAKILEGLPLLTLGGVGGGSALMAALMNGEGA